MSLSRSTTRLLRSTSSCPACLAALPLPLPRHHFSPNLPSPIPSTSRSFTSYTLPRRAPILDQTPNVPPPVAVNPTTSSPNTKPKRTIRARKAAVSLTPTAVTRIRALLDSPSPKLIRVGVRNKGCAGMSYHLEYVDKPEKFDEIVEQDGVRVVIDSKALFSIIGSEMDWQEDALQARFVFNNPNIKDACGCGESFIV
ncbi:Fe-binding Fe/S cluster assembly protein ISA1 [Sporobolomyces salmoneus]|uniref:Fe-binding Fe/S cluster assembly protein ISA1 n=1 Tax=Sporobolomyces salmoneus TaxID=183962 RepID=UPI0031711FB8